MERDIAEAVDLGRERPASPVRLTDHDVAAWAYGRHEGSKRSIEAVPDESRAEAQRDIPGLGLRTVFARVSFDDLDKILEAGVGDAFSSNVRELRGALDANNAATERQGEDERRSPAPASDVEHATLGA